LEESGKTDLARKALEQVSLKNLFKLWIKSENNWAEGVGRNKFLRILKFRPPDATGTTLQFPNIAPSL
jgi:hypothetical protein